MRTEGARLPIPGPSTREVTSKPFYGIRQHGNTWSVYEIDARRSLENAVLHNLKEWQAKAIAAVLNSNL